jgi:hypothetical protein
MPLARRSNIKNIGEEISLNSEDIAELREEVTLVGL